MIAKRTYIVVHSRLRKKCNKQEDIKEYYNRFHDNHFPKQFIFYYFH